MITHRTLFKRDKTGRIRVWAIEQDGSSYNYVTGLQDGALVRSAPTIAAPASRKTPELQADFEVGAAYTHQLKRDYFETIEEVDTPRFLAPMLAKKYDSWPGIGFSQPKLDGVRCILRATGAWSREGQPLLGVPHIIADHVSFFEANPDAILDGELYNHDLKDDFEEISGLTRREAKTPDELAQSKALIQYHIYDYPSFPGKFGARSAALHALALPAVDRKVETAAVYSEDAADKLFLGYLDDRYEGGIYRLDAEYDDDKRSKNLLKRKLFEDAEFKVVRIEQGTGNWAGYAKKVICLLPDGREFGAGVKGNKAFTKALLTQDQREVTLRFKGYTGYGVPRHAVSIKWHGKGRTA